MSNQRPASTPEFGKRQTKDTNSAPFGDDGICDACRFFEYKQTINWDERRLELQELCDRYRSKDGSWDVIVPGSGGKDSIFVAHILKNEFGMNPLTVTWAPHAFTDVGWHNLQAWQRMGFDNMLVTPDPKLHAFITRHAFLRLLNPFQPFIIGQKTIAMKFALKLNIPFIMYGENAGERHNKFEEGLSPKMDLSHVTRADDSTPIYLGGLSFEELKAEGYDEGALKLYKPSLRQQVIDSGVDVYHMTHFVPWATQRNYYVAKEVSDFQSNPLGRSEGTYSKYASLDDKIDGFHYFTMFAKFGQGRAVDDACRDIRDGYITREEGVALVNRYDGEFPKNHFEFFLDYIGIDEERFWQAIDENRSPHLWGKSENGWVLKHPCV